MRSARSSPESVADRPGPLVACIVAAALIGLADALVTLSTNPDPAAAPLRVGYALGPVLLGLGFGAPLGTLLAVLVGWRGGRAAAAGVATVMALWWLGIVLDAWRGGEGAAALGTVAVAVGVAALALGRLALDVARRFGRIGARARKAAAAGSIGALVAAFAVTAPAGFRVFRGGTGPCPAGGASPRDAPNIVLITVDALRADDARAMDSYRRLAARGIEYLEHVTASPWTLPSIASLLTGLPPDRHGAGRSLSSRSVLAKAPLPPTIPTLAAGLGAHGYRTHAIVTNPFLVPRYGIDQGFCTFENVTMAGESVRGLAHTTLLRFVRALAPRLLPSDRADVVAARAARWLGAQGGGPFFLWLHFLDPHAPYGDRDGESTSLTLDLMAFEQERGLGEPFAGVGLLRAGEFRPSLAERRHIVELYRQDVLFADRGIDWLLDRLAASRLLERTAVILTADHGEEFWEHGGVEHGHTLYDEVLRIPLVIVPPGGVAPEVRREMTSVVDVAATIAELAGLPAGAFTGTSLLHPAPERALRLGNLLFGEEWTGVRTPQFKYMRAEHGEERLFDLARDPGETLNQVAARSDLLAEGRALLADTR